MPSDNEDTADGHLELEDEEYDDEEVVEDISDDEPDEDEEYYGDDLAALGYYFDDSGKLRSLETGNPFQFTNQKDYETIGDAVTEDVYDRLQEQCGLERVPLKPSYVDAGNVNIAFAFATPNLASKKIILLLIHGMGVVRAGQWARKLIINDCLDHGTQIPYIKKAHENGWGVVVANTNYNSVVINGRNIPLKWSHTPAVHLESIFNFVLKGIDCELFIVAHSRGGPDISTYLGEHSNEQRCGLVCLTDSRFIFKKRRGKRPIIVINWLAQTHDEVFPSKPSACVKALRDIQLSADTLIHEESSYKAFESLFYILEKFAVIPRDKYIDHIDEHIGEAMKLCGYTPEAVKEVLKSEGPPPIEDDPAVDDGAEAAGDDDSDIQIIEDEEEDEFLDGELNEEEFESEDVLEGEQDDEETGEDLEGEEKVEKEKVKEDDKEDVKSDAQQKTIKRAHEDVDEETGNSEDGGKPTPSKKAKET